MGMEIVVDPDIRLWRTSCGASGHLARVANLIWFQVSHAYFFVRGGHSLYPNCMGAMAEFSLWIRHCMEEWSKAYYTAKSHLIFRLR